MHDLKAMRHAASVSATVMAARLGIAPETFRDLEDGNLIPSEELLERWHSAVGFALSHDARRRKAAPRALRRLLIRLS